MKSFRGILLLPISILYGMITSLRNILFNIGIFRQRTHPVTVISVGNLSMGGTGKTPFVEYLINLLKDDYQVATLSRGYGRKTKGYRLADEKSNANMIGDEPMQYFHKFNNIVIAVDEKRNRGVSKLIKQDKDIEVVVLDDAFQHRWIKPDLSIMLTDYHKMYHQDFVVPSGSLREFRAGSRRADIIIVTKTPVVLSPITRREIADEMKLKPYQKLLFSKIEYDGFYKWGDDKDPVKISEVSTIVLFTGIANSYPLQDYLKRKCTELVVLTFPDHHDFKEKDIQLIHQTFDDQFTTNKILVTTEKDIQRLEVCSKSDTLKELALFYVPIHICFHHNDEQDLQSSLQNLFRRI
jgi:tetraacyldisaccharide 4'-kinase